MSPTSIIDHHWNMVIDQETIKIESLKDFKNSNEIGVTFINKTFLERGELSDYVSKMDIENFPSLPNRRRLSIIGETPLSIHVPMQKSKP